MDSLPPRINSRGHSVYCGLCWDLVYLLWVDDEAPDYTACAIGKYTAQTCPNALASANMAAIRHRAAEAGMTFLQYLMAQPNPAKSGASSPSNASAGNPATDDPKPVLPANAKGMKP